MSLIKKIQEIIGSHPSPKDKTIRDLREQVKNSNAPFYAKCCMKDAIEYVRKCQSYESNRALSNVDPSFIPDGFQERLKAIPPSVKVRSNDARYWFSSASTNAWYGDLEYKSDLECARRWAKDSPEIVIDDKVTEVEATFQRRKWKAVPPRIIDHLRSATNSMALGKPQAEINEHLKKAEEYAATLGYTLRKPD